MADKPITHYCGYAVVVENPSSSSVANPSKSSTNHTVTSRVNNYDKQDGSYVRGTVKESYSSGDYKNHSRVGYKDEYKTSSTVRVGDKSGFTEFSQQEKVTRVNYDSGSSSSSSKGNNGRYYGGGNRYLE